MAENNVKYFLCTCVCLWRVTLSRKKKGIINVFYMYLYNFQGTGIVPALITIIL